MQPHLSTALRRTSRIYSSIRIGFSTTPGWPSRLIRWATRSKYSHSYMTFHREGMDWVLESSAKGVTLTPLSRFVRTNTVLEEFDLVDYGESERSAVVSVLEYLSQGYDWKALVGQALVVLLGLIGIKGAHNPFRDKTSFICTELVWDFCRRSGYEDVATLDRETITPQQLFEVLSVSPHFKKKGA